MTFDFQGLGSGDLTLFGGIGFEGIATKALEAVKEDMAEGTKKALRQSISHSGESELVNSVKCYKPTMTRNGEGAKLVCQPSGRSKSGNTYNRHNTKTGKNAAVYNNDKAFWLEYGRHGQDAKPWKDRAISSIEPTVDQKIEQIVAKELGAT